MESSEAETGDEKAVSPTNSLRWVPLEANPAVINQLIEKLGVSGPLEFVDVYGLDDDALDFLPQPVTAMILLFPINENYLRHEREESEAVKNAAVPADVYFTRQTIGTQTENACGTIAVIHVLANNSDVMSVDPNGVFGNIMRATCALSPDEKAQVLEGDAVLARLHATSAAEGDSMAPSPDVDVNLHFVALVCKNDRLYELDGRKHAPVDRGPTTHETFLKDAARACRNFMERDPTIITFTMLAFTTRME